NALPLESVRSYLLSKGNVPMTALEISKGAGIPRTTVRSILDREDGRIFVHRVIGSKIKWIVSESPQSSTQLIPKELSRLTVFDNSQKLKPKDAVVKLLQDNPEGLQAGEITNALEGNILSESGDQKNLLYSTLGYLLKTGVIERKEDRRMVLVRKPRAE